MGGVFPQAMNKGEMEMTILIEEREPSRTITRDIAGSRALIPDLKRFANRRLPSLRDHERPLINNCMMIPWGLPALSGQFVSHLWRGQKNIITTTLLGSCPILAGRAPGRISIGSGHLGINSILEKYDAASRSYLYRS